MRFKKGPFDSAILVIDGSESAEAIMAEAKKIGAVHNGGDGNQYIVEFPGRGTPSYLKEDELSDQLRRFAKRSPEPENA